MHLTQKMPKREHISAVTGHREVDVAKVIDFGGQQKESPDQGLSNIDKMQLAVQIAALVRASFKKPSEADVRDLLQMAANQLSAPGAQA